MVFLDPMLRMILREPQSPWEPAPSATGVSELARWLTHAGTGLTPSRAQAASANVQQLRRSTL